MTRNREALREKRARSYQTAVYQNTMKILHYVVGCENGRFTHASLET